MTAEREQVVADHWRRFGKWLEDQRVAARLSATEAAKAADLHLTSWSRLENGVAGTKRTTLPRILEAVGIRERDPRYLEGFQLAGFVAPSGWEIIGVDNAPGPIRNDPDGERLDRDFTTEDPILLSIQAFYLGAPPELRSKMLGAIAKVVTEAQREETTFGKKADDA